MAEDDRLRLGPSAFDKECRARVDAVIRTVLGVPDGAHCPEVWAAVKALAPAERDDLARRVGEAL